jgi:hypothetical protein
MSKDIKNPAARRENILIEEVGGELLIFDVSNNRAHCLNESAAAIWRHCDGTRSVDDLAQHLFPKLVPSDAERVVSLGIERLSRRRLLENSRTAAPAIDLSKRDLLKKVAILAAAAGIAAPLISSAMAPTSAYAFSCTPTGGHCTTGGECCTGFCMGGTTCA